MKEKINLEELIDIEEVSSLLRISISTLRKMCMRKEIPFHKLGRRVLFYKPEIVKWVRNNKAA